MQLAEILHSFSPAYVHKVTSQSGIAADRLAQLTNGAPALPSEVVAIARALRLHPSSLLGTAHNEARLRSCSVV